ncbi:MAG: hypothetical protein PVF58_07990 [Candidatus Methanofastidiosia archaeon]|jgi:hypothetical protein
MNPRKKQRLQHLLLTTVLFAIIFGLLLFFIGIEGVESTGSKIMAVIIGSIAFFTFSYFVGKRR